MPTIPEEASGSPPESALPTKPPVRSTGRSARAGGGARSIKAGALCAADVDGGGGGGRTLKGKEGGAPRAGGARGAGGGGGGGGARGAAPPAGGRAASLAQRGATLEDGKGD